MQRSFVSTNQFWPWRVHAKDFCIGYARPHGRALPTTSISASPNRTHLIVKPWRPLPVLPCWQRNRPHLLNDPPSPNFHRFQSRPLTAAPAPLGEMGTAPATDPLMDDKPRTLSLPSDGINRPRSAKTLAGPGPSDWEAKKALIYHLYVVQDETLTRVMNTIRQEDPSFRARYAYYKMTVELLPLLRNPAQKPSVQPTMLIPTEGGHHTAFLQC